MRRLWWKIIAAIYFSCLPIIIPQIVVAAEENSRDVWQTLLISWGPMLLLIAVWIYFVRRLQGKGKSWSLQETNQHLEKIEQSLERIARALEKK